MSKALAESVVWELESLYEGPSDPELEVDRQWCRQQADSFAEDYRGKVSELLPQALLDAVYRFENLQERLQKLLSFAALHFATRTHDAGAGALWQATLEFYSTIRRDTLFFELEWTQLGERDAQAILSSGSLDRYRHYLESLRRYKPHLLSETEERILAEKEPAGTSAWSTLFDKVVSQLRFGDKQRTQSEVLSDLYHAERDARKLAALELTDGLRGVLHILAHTFNIILLDKSIMDRLRQYPHWLRARNLTNEVDDDVVGALVDAVASRYDLVHRYYRLKRRLLDYEELFDYDRYAPVPGLPKKVFPWGEAQEIVLAAYESFSPRMAEIAGRFFDERWIHAPVMPGKRGGAFAHSTVPSLHPFILLNYTGTYRDIMTLAHELGHGIHQYLARKQGLFNSETPLTMAESASVFGEMIVFRHILERIEDSRERAAVLCSKLEDIFATTFRQISMNRFEDAIHTERREKGELAPERFSDLWIESQGAMFGDAVRLLEHYNIWWCYIPHFIHSPGYVYSYAFGELLVLALYRKYEEMGADFVPLYLELLEAGGKARPDELLRPFGIDLADPLFWNEGLTILEDLLSRAEGASGSGSDSKEQA